jgi:hypothetical protein
MKAQELNNIKIGRQHLCKLANAPLNTVIFLKDGDSSPEFSKISRGKIKNGKPIVTTIPAVKVGKDFDTNPPFNERTYVPYLIYKLEEKGFIVDRFGRDYLIRNHDVDSGFMNLSQFREYANRMLNLSVLGSFL